jgi:hypothetical protein
MSATEGWLLLDPADLDAAEADGRLALDLAAGLDRETRDIIREALHPGEQPG